MIYDYINGAFELLGAVATWANFVRLRSDRHIAGVNWSSMAFFAVWGLWNLVYYPSLHQWASTVGGSFLVLGNLAWLALVAKLKSESLLARVQEAKRVIFGGQPPTGPSGGVDSSSKSSQH